MEIIIREIGSKFLRFQFFPNSQRWVKQNPPAEFCVATIGDVACFVKRQNRPFSGWGLLVKAISDRQIRGAPRVISLAQENGFYYYFTERLNGQTLDEFRKTSHVSKLNLKKLVNDIFIAFRNINEHGYWYSDLCTKNIFVSKSGDFSLIDLDSCVAGTKLYEFHGKTSFEYPPLLIDFAKNVAFDSTFQIRTLQGECVNQAEIVALAMDCKHSFVFPIESKAKIMRKILTRTAEREFNDLFYDLLACKPNWVKARRLIDKISA